MIKKWMILFDAIVLAIAISAAWLFITSYNQTSEREEIKVGVIAPLSGNFALQGERIRNGLELAREDLLKQNISVTLIYEDACTASQTVPAFGKLVESDGIKILGASFCLVGFSPLLPLAEEKNILMFNTAKNPSTILNRSFVFSTNLAIREDSEFHATYAISKGAKTGAIVYYATPFGQDFAKFIPLYFEQNGGKMLSSLPVELSATDFRTELAKIKDANPDVVFAVHLSNSLGNFIRQARELGINATIISNSEAEDPSVITAAGSAAEGFIVSTSEPANKTQKMLQLEETYIKRYGAFPDPLALNAYDSLMLQAYASTKCNGDIECMKIELHKIRDYDGVSGTITIRQDGSSSKPLSIKVVRNGKFVRLHEIPDKIKLGVSLPITGAASNLGEWALQGIQIAKDEENFDINVQDDQCQGQPALNAYNNLKFSGIKFIAGPICNAASIPVANLVEEDKNIMITLGVSTKTIREAGNYSFTILPPIEAQTIELAEFISNKNITSASIIYVQDEYGVENKETFEKAFSPSGTIVNSEVFERTNTDFRSSLIKIKSDSSQALILVGYSANFVNLIKQIKELNITKQLFSVSNIQDPNIIVQTGNISEGIIYTYPQISTSDTFSTFLQKYNQKFGKNVTILPMYIGAGYDAAKILSNAIRICNKDTECVKDEILKIKNYHGVNGIISIDEKGNSQMPIELRLISNNTFVRYG